MLAGGVKSLTENEKQRTETMNVFIVFKSYFRQDNPILPNI